MGLKRDKTVSASKLKKALQALGFEVLKCEKSSKNFLVQVDSDANGKQGISARLEGDECSVNSLTGSHGINGVSMSDLEKQ
jgi:hypothetical protein